MIDGMVKAGYYVCYVITGVMAVLSILALLLGAVDMGWITIVLISSAYLANRPGLKQQRLYIYAIGIIIVSAHLFGFKIIGNPGYYTNTVLTHPTSIIDITPPNTLHTADGRTIVLKDIILEEGLEDPELKEYAISLLNQNNELLSVEFNEHTQSWITSEPIRRHACHGMGEFFPARKPRYRAVPLEEHLTGMFSRRIFRRVNNKQELSPNG